MAVSITAKVSQPEHERFLQIGREYGCSNTFQFAQFIVDKILKGEMAVIKGNADLKLKSIGDDELIKSLSEELQKAKTQLPALFYKNGYEEAEENFKKKAGAMGLKANFYDENIAKAKGCGSFGTCLFSRKNVKDSISHIKTIDEYEKRNAN